MFSAVPSPFLVQPKGPFVVAQAPTVPPHDAPAEADCKRRLRDLVKALYKLQRVLYADNRYAVLLVFQAMDAAGKDSTIRAVMTGVNPAGCQVVSFKRPSSGELDHDFLWRTSRCLPERGRIGVFNRSYYEEVLIVRVHPSILARQNLPNADLSQIWQERFESIRQHELHLAKNGTVILKFWLNVSKKEQRQRFLSRLDSPEKNWKFSISDVEERGHWGAYMRTYEEALIQTSQTYAPWYAIPADNKPFMRYAVAEIIVRSLQSLDMQYPVVDDGVKAKFDEMRALLLNED